MDKIRTDIPGAWRTLFARAMQLIDELEQRTGHAPFWTLGGGTVLMLRYRHRQSKDIDIFFPDPRSPIAFLSESPRRRGTGEMKPKRIDFVKLGPQDILPFCDLPEKNAAVFQ